MDELSQALAGLVVERTNRRRRIISFCLYGNRDIYNVGAIQNAKLASQIYPGWEVIMYVGRRSVDHGIKEALIAAGVEIRLFDDHHAQGYAPLLLRFLPAAEEDVEIVLFRDTDSRLNQREAFAVSEWLSGGDTMHKIKKFHVMHEAMHSQESILGGMWGVRSLPEESGAPLPNFAQDIRTYMQQYHQQQISLPYGADMNFLTLTILPHLNASNTMYHCSLNHKNNHHQQTHNRHPSISSLQPLIFPSSPYHGFVGQPINCVHMCDWQHFLQTGCPHVQALSYLTPELSTALRHKPNLLENVAAFL